jgi:hypothetical protein
MKAVEEFEGRGELLWPGAAARPVGYRLTRHQGVSANGLPIPGLFRIEGHLDFGGDGVPDEAIGPTLTLRLADGRSMGVTMTSRDGRVLSEGHGPSRCLCC